MRVLQILFLREYQSNRNVIPLDDAAHTAIAILGLLANNVPFFIELPLVLIAPRRRDPIIQVITSGFATNHPQQSDPARLRRTAIRQLCLSASIENSGTRPRCQLIVHASDHRQSFTKVSCRFSKWRTRLDGAVSEPFIGIAMS